MKFLSLWTWLAIVAIWNYLPPTHPWRSRGRCFTLREWHEGATEATHLFDLLFWGAAIASPMVFMILLNKLLT